MFKKAVSICLIFLFVSYLASCVVSGVKPGQFSSKERLNANGSIPQSVNAYGKIYDMVSLQNPVHVKVLEKLKTEPDTAGQIYQDAINAGNAIYFKNCFSCHGALLDGEGHQAGAFDPQPTNFLNTHKIKELSDFTLFWRITKGGSGAPKNGKEAGKEGMPWKSAMPAWQDILSEDDVWNVITFLDDYMGKIPPISDQAVTELFVDLKDKLAQQRETTPQALYQYRCAVCHGEQGAGDGSVAQLLYPRPRDFTFSLLKYKSSPGDLPPRDEDLFHVIKYGLPGTSMPAWEVALSDEQIKSLIPVIKRFDTSAIWAPEDAEDEAFDEDGHYLGADLLVVKHSERVEGQISYLPASIAKGKEVYLDNCKKCHGLEGRGDIYSGKFMSDDWSNRVWARDLTKPWTWRTTESFNGEAVNVNNKGNASTDRAAAIRNIYIRLSVGVPGTPMPAHRAEEGEEDPISLEDRWHVANYVYSLGKEAPLPGETNIIVGSKVTTPLPNTVDDSAWDNATAVTFHLVPSVTKEERLYTQLNNAVSVRALYNDSEVAFLLEVNDRTDSRPGGPIIRQLPKKDEVMFADAFALRFPQRYAFTPAPMSKPFFNQGDKGHALTLWYWNAGSVSPPVKERFQLMDTDGVSQDLRLRVTSPDFVASGQWQHGRWRVLMKRLRNGKQSTQDIAFNSGQYIPISLANWDGNNGEIGAKHTLTQWQWLLLP